MEKIQDVTRSFDGSGNVENWIKKIRLVAKLKEVKKLESFLPLFLEGDAFAPCMTSSQRNQKAAYRRLSRHCSAPLPKIDTVPMTPLGRGTAMVSRRSGRCVYVRLCICPSVEIIFFRGN